MIRVIRYCAFEDKKDFDKRCKRLRSGLVQPTVVMGVENVTAWVCDTCGTPGVIPGDSILSLMKGLKIWK